MFSFDVNFLFNTMPSTSVYWQPTAWWLLCLPDIFQIFLYINRPQAEILYVQSFETGGLDMMIWDMMYGRRCRHENEGNECPHPVVTWPWLQKMIMTRSFHMGEKRKIIYIHVYIYIYTSIIQILIYSLTTADIGTILVWRHIIPIQKSLCFSQATCCISTLKKNVHPSFCNILLCNLQIFYFKIFNYSTILCTDQYKMIIKMYCKHSSWQ